MASLHTNPLFSRLESAQRVLVAGAGAGSTSMRDSPSRSPCSIRASRSTPPICLSALSKDCPSMPGSRRRRRHHSRNGPPPGILPGTHARPVARPARLPEPCACLLPSGRTTAASRLPGVDREVRHRCGRPRRALFVDAVAHAHHTPDHPSIVNGSIAAAVHGAFGDVQFTSRTRGSELFINPLMTLCFAFELDGVARNCLYLDRIEDTHLIRQVSSAIEAFREEVRQRPPRRIPH